MSTLEFDLGVGIVYENAPQGRHYKLDYGDLGKRAWIALRQELYAKLCDRRKKRPRAWLGEVLEGDVRNLALGVVSAVVSTYDVSLGVGVPAAALILKRGLNKYCANPFAEESVSFRALLRKTVGMHREVVQGSMGKSGQPPNKALQPTSRAKRRSDSKRRVRVARG